MASFTLTLVVIQIFMLTIGVKGYDTDWAGILEDVFIEHKLVPDVVSDVPYTLLSVKFDDDDDDDADIEPGQEFPAKNMALPPFMTWKCHECENALYTLVMIDPDATGSLKGRQFLHWMAKTTDCDSTEVNTMSLYKQPSPGPGTGLHRYTFLVFVNCDELGLSEKLKKSVNAVKDKAKFRAKDFGRPYAGNMLLAGSDVLKKEVLPEKGKIPVGI